MLALSSSVSGDSLLLTKEYGYKPINECLNSKVHVWNGITWGTANIKLVGESEKILTVITDSGITIDVSPYEQIWMIQDTNRAIRKTTNELIFGDKLLLHTLSHIYHGNDVIPTAYDLGVSAGNSLKYCSIAGTNTNDIVIPGNNYIMQIRLNWLSGLLDTNGHLTVNDDHASIQINMISPEFLIRLKLLLQELGIQSAIHKLNINRLYSTSQQGLWYLRIENNEIVKLRKLGLATKKLNIHSVTRNGYVHSDFITIASVIDSAKRKDLYSCIESKLKMFMVNGILIASD